MNTFIRFFYEFISVFFDGVFTILKGIAGGAVQIVNFNSYRKIINGYRGSFEGPEWIFVALAIAIIVVIIGLTGLLIFFAIRKILRFKKNKLDQEDLLNEIADLNGQVVDLMKEKNEIMAMKVSQLGLKPDEKNTIDVEEDKDGKKEEKKDGAVIRFPKLDKIDEIYKNYKVQNYNNNFTLQELLESFRNFAGSQLRLYYDESLLRAFIAGLACSRLIILQGISGTGKTSLAYAWGKFVKQDSCIASVQPSWRDKTELLGYFNEFTKKFNETEVLAHLYAARLDDDVHTIILDEMNIARVEYYFAEMLSILEMPSKDEWIVELVTTSWPTDPKGIVSGKLLLPGNLWYIGTLNNDDSTFMVTDKVYDRSMPIDINNKVEPFKCKEQEALSINSSYLENLFQAAGKEHILSDQNAAKIKELDYYVVEHFRVAFGNRVMKQMLAFISVYVGCGGKEVDAIDYFISKKIFRKFDQLNIALIREEIDPFIVFMNKLFGNGAMKECIETVVRLKKSR